MKNNIRNACSRALCLSLVVFLGSATAFSSVPAQRDQQEAEALWEKAIAAKGGRERLHEIKTLLISYDDSVRNFLGVVVHRGTVVSLYAFPDKSWGWDDGLPPPFSLTVTVLNVAKDLRCVVRRKSAAATCGPARQAGLSPTNEGINQAQYLYLMETKWVRPVPYSVTSDRIGLTKVDVLHTRFENKRIDYYLDRKTHLARRVAVFYGKGNRPTFTTELSDYLNIDGVQIPGKQKHGAIRFEINPRYREKIFEGPPSIAAGPDAWRGD